MSGRPVRNMIGVSESRSKEMTQGYGQTRTQGSSQSMSRHSHWKNRRRGTQAGGDRQARLEDQRNGSGRPQERRLSRQGQKQASPSAKNLISTRATASMELGADFSTSAAGAGGSIPYRSVLRCREQTESRAAEQRSVVKAKTVVNCTEGFFGDGVEYGTVHN